MVANVLQTASGVAKMPIANGISPDDSLIGGSLKPSAQATAGAVLSVWLRRTAHYLELAVGLRKNGYYLVAADLNGVAEPSILNRQSKLLLALGNEAAGISKELLDVADCRLRIPTIQEKAESLNVAVCGAICMYLSSQIA